MAALPAARHHQTLRPFYQKLVANGKRKMVAVMRKLIINCNAVLRPVTVTVAAGVSPAV